MLFSLNKTNPTHPDYHRHFIDQTHFWPYNYFFHAKKTMAMTLSRERNAIYHPPLFLDNTSIQKTSTHKHLGLTFFELCNWVEHVRNISDKARIRLNLLRVLKFRESGKSLEKIYSSVLLGLSSNIVTSLRTIAPKKLKHIYMQFTSK